MRVFTKHLCNLYRSINQIPVHVKSLPIPRQKRSFVQIYQHSQCADVLDVCFCLCMDRMYLYPSKPFVRSSDQKYINILQLTVVSHKKCVYFCNTCDICLAFESTSTSLSCTAYGNQISRLNLNFRNIPLKTPSSRIPVDICVGRFALSDKRDTQRVILDVIWIVDSVSTSAKITVEISPFRLFLDVEWRKREPQ